MRFAVQLATQLMASELTMPADRDFAIPKQVALEFAKYNMTSSMPDLPARRAGVVSTDLGIARESASRRAAELAATRVQDVALAGAATFNEAFALQNQTQAGHVA